MICISEMRSVIPNDVDDEFEDEGGKEGKREESRDYKRQDMQRKKACEMI